MRQQLPLLRHLILLLALVFTTGSVAADSRSDARTHYQAGVKAYNAKDYQAAIREFSAAQQLLPADLNNYNLALCYDKLGDPEPAIQYYRAYLDKVPSTDKRAEIEASIARLEAASKSVAAKRAAEAKKAEDARRAAEAKQAAEDAKLAAQAEEARKAEEARRRETAPDVAPPAPTGPTGPMIGGASGTPGDGTTVSTGDAQLDRAAAIDINQIRDQRVGGAASGIPAAPSAGPSAGPNAYGTAGAQAGVPPAGPATAAAPQGAPAVAPGAPVDDKPKVTPVYKKWWFWAVIAVSAFVVYNIATEDGSSSTTRQGVEGRALLPSPGVQQPTGGATLLRW